jgi:hypothetical protein
VSVVLSHDAHLESWFPGRSLRAVRRTEGGLTVSLDEVLKFVECSRFELRHYHGGRSPLYCGDARCDDCPYDWMQIVNEEYRLVRKKIYNDKSLNDS